MQMDLCGGLCCDGIRLFIVWSFLVCPNVTPNFLCDSDLSESVHDSRPAKVFC